MTLEILEKRVNEFVKAELGPDFYTDDWKWNDAETQIEFDIWECLGRDDNGKPKERRRAIPHFTYDEEHWMTLDEQIEEFLDDLRWGFGIYTYDNFK